MPLLLNNNAINKVSYNNNVGYTIVGSPTIVDGIASGFSNSKYITIPITPTQLPHSEIHVRFTTGSTVNSEQMILWLKQNNSLSPFIGFQTHPNGNHLYMYSYSSGVIYTQSNFTIQPNTTYECTVIINNNKLNWYLGTPGNLVQQTELNFNLPSGTTFNNPLCFGAVLSSGYPFMGSIDLNKTYIKINGITWFNGREQASSTVNYVKINNILVWTNPNL